MGSAPPLQRYGGAVIPPFTMLQQRAKLLAAIRAFFGARSVMEVETPAMGQAPATDPALAPLITRYDGPGGARDYYLQSSPEYAMKRLLCAGSGSIYQLGKAFRNGEFGRHHSPEFTLLEWYRSGFDYQQLMDEVSALLRVVAGLPLAQRMSYQSAFEQALGIDPHQVSVEQLLQVAATQELHIPESLAHDRDGLLDLLLTQGVEPWLPKKVPVFLFDYPVSQAALARIRTDTPPVAERFELYLNGLELANGYSELTDADEYRRRFAADNSSRCEAGLPEVPLDAELLQALDSGLPDCAGVALGVDRLLMAITGAESLDRVALLPQV